MIFWFNRDVVLPTNETVGVKIVAGANKASSDETFGPDILVHETSVLDYFLSQGVIKVAAINEKNLLYPVLTEIVDTSQCVDVTPIFHLVNKYLAEHGALTQQFTKVLLGKLVSAFGLSENDATGIVYYVTEFDKYENTETAGPIEIGPGYFDTRFLTNTQSFINEINSAMVWPFTAITQEENVTNFLTEPTGPLFIEFPSRNSLMREDVQIQSLLPKLESLCNPYGMYHIDDISQYKADPRFPESAYPLVEGQAKNNTSDLYDNERLYAKCLIEWVQFNMRSAAIGDVDVSPSSPNIDRLSQTYLEELAKLLYTKHWYHNLNIPIYSELAEQNGDLVDLLEESSDTSSDSVTSDYMFRTTPEEQSLVKFGYKEIDIKGSKKTNALEQLVSFLKEASLTVGYQAYVEAIVQLARWGDRKPTAILISGYPLIFSLGDNKKKQYMGNITDYKLKLEDGCKMRAVSAIYDNMKMGCKNFLMVHNYAYDSIVAPLGVLTVKTLENTTDVGPKQRVTYCGYSIIDVVLGYLNDDTNMKMAGITYDGKQFHADSINMAKDCTYASILQSIKEDDNLGAPIAASPDVEDQILSLGIYVAKIITHFDIFESCAALDDLDLYVKMNSFSSKEDLEKKNEAMKIRSKQSAFKYAYANKIIPIYVKASLKLNELVAEREITFTDVLNVYADILRECNLSVFCEADVSAEKKTQEMSAFSEQAVSSSEESSGATLANGATTLAGVNTTENQATVSITQVAEHAIQEESKPISADATRFSFIKEADQTKPIIKIVDRDNECVGYCTQEHVVVNTTKGPAKKLLFTLMQPKELENTGNVQENKVLSITDIIYRMMFDLYAYEIDDTHLIFLYFSSTDCMAYYVQLLNRLKKEHKI